MRRTSSLGPRWRAVLIALLAITAAARSVAQPPPQYEIAVSPVAIEPADPAAGQRTVLTVVLRSRALTPVSRPASVNLRVVLARSPQGEGAAETIVGENLGALRIGDAAMVSLPWVAEPGSHALIARVEVLPGQRIAAGEVQLASEPPTTLTVPAPEPASQAAANSIVVRPPGTAEPGRTIRAPSQGERQPNPDRRITTTALGIVGAPGTDDAASGLVIDVPVYVVNAAAVRAVDIRCSVFAQSLGDLIGTGQVTRPVAGGSLAEMVSVAIVPRPGRARSRATRYSCLATYTTDEAAAEPRARPPAGVAGTAARRAGYERRLGRALVSFSDLIEGEIDPR